MDERDFFDRLAPQWDANETNSTPERVEEILALMDIRPSMSVLDLGTGTGVLLPAIAKLVGPEGKICAVDYSEGMLNLARKKFSNLLPRPHFLNLDFETETIPGEYDRIILYCVYPHLNSPVETLKWLRKVNLRPEGEIFIAFPTDEKFINNIHRERHSESDILPDAETLAAFLSNAGLDAVSISPEAKTYIIRIK